MHQTEIKRVAKHYNISQDEVKERAEMLEIQRKMTLAYSLNKATSKN